MKFLLASLVVIVTISIITASPSAVAERRVERSVNHVGGLLTGVFGLLNTATRVLDAVLQPTVATVATAIPCVPTAVVVPAASTSLIDPYFVQINALLSAISSTLGSNGPLVVGTVASVADALNNILTAITALSIGTLTVLQFVAICGPLLNVLTTILALLSVIIGQVVNALGDPVATVLSAVINLAFKVAHLVADFVANVLIGLNASPSPSAILTLIQGALQSFTVSLNTALTVATRIASAVGSNGLLTGVLAVVSGLAVSIVAGLATAATIFDGVVHVSVGVSLGGLTDLAAQLSDAISASLTTGVSVA